MFFWKKGFCFIAAAPQRIIIIVISFVPLPLSPFGKLESMLPGGGLLYGPIKQFRASRWPLGWLWANLRGRVGWWKGRPYLDLNGSGNSAFLAPIFVRPPTHPILSLWVGSFLSFPRERERERERKRVEEKKAFFLGREKEGVKGEGRGEGILKKFPPPALLRLVLLRLSSLPFFFSFSLSVCVFPPRSPYLLNASPSLPPPPTSFSSSLLCRKGFLRNGKGGSKCASRLVLVGRVVGGADHPSRVLRFLCN